MWDEGRFKYRARDVCGKLLLGEKRSEHKSRRWGILEGKEEVSNLMIKNCKQDQSSVSGDWKLLMRREEIRAIAQEI